MSLPDLPSFHDFFRAVYGYAPYPWQQRLAQHIVDKKAWPRTIGVPTGCGKTSTMAISLWTLAAEAHLPANERSAPRRVVMVVDRRTIVDQSFRDAEKLSSALHEPTAPALAAVRARLLSLMAPGTDGQVHDDPLQLALLRGGIPRDDSWARRPDQAILAVSTVDQVGSRLLFRGYGVSDRMLPMHAGLLGNDTLFLLDEVHLARPFQELLAVLEGKYRTFHAEASPTHARWQVVSLSATSGDQDAFHLDEADKQHERLERRLEAPKRVDLLHVDSATHGRSGPSRRWVKAFHDEVHALAEWGCRAVGVVVNRVDTAVALTRAISSDRKLGAEVQLVTGRMRPCDRGRATEQLKAGAGPDRTRRGVDDPPYVCIATQTIEAGADLDFDGMVTEVASLDALVQRFGRVNRTGQLADTPAPIRVLAPKDLDKGEDPIYGDAMPAAWAWLEAQRGDTGIDASPARLSERMRADLASVKRASAPEVPTSVLTPDQLDVLARTSPCPRPSPPVDDFLHGRQRERKELTVLWRADVLPLDDEEDASAWARRTTAALRAVPPGSLETLTLPLHAARAWLAGEGLTTFSDVTTETGAEEPRRAPSAVVGASWNGDAATPVTVRELRPDMVLVLPALRGGLASDNFAPDNDTPIADTGDLARTVASGFVHLRLDLRVYGLPFPDGHDEPRWPWKVEPPKGTSSDRSLRDVQRDVGQWLDDVVKPWLHGEPDEPPVATQRLLRTLLEELTTMPVDVAQRGRGARAVLILRGRRRLTPQRVLALAQQQATLGDDGRTADVENGASRSSRAVPLGEHLQGVGSWAKRLAERCLLPPELVHDLALAGTWHDLGKAHPRFQTLLHGGDDILALAALADSSVDALRAKSDIGFTDRAGRARARERARLPRGFRHEMVSVALLEDSEEGRQLLARAHDPALVLHLVASHHGYARPFAPVEDHGAVEELRRGVRVRFDDVELTAPGDHHRDALGSGVAERFFTVQQRYGWHTLAYLEAILRLADHRRSEEEERLIGSKPGWFQGRRNGQYERGRQPPHAHLLPGLDGSNPLAFLAALGALVALDDDAVRRGELRPRLSWRHVGTWQPVLHTTIGDFDELVLRLDEDRRARANDPALTFTYNHKGKRKHDVKPSPEELHAALRAWRQKAKRPGDAASNTLAWFRGFVSEGVVDNNGAAKPTPLHFTAGQQQFLAMALDLASNTSAADLITALRGPWDYRSSLPVMGWDATETRDYALRATDPSTDKKAGNPGADWLALRALQLFGTARDRGRQQAPGTEGGWKTGSFSWPIWTRHITVDEVAGLLDDPWLLRSERPARDRRGVAQVFRSRILRSDQGGYGSMLPASAQ